MVHQTYIHCLLAASRKHTVVNCVHNAINKGDEYIIRRTEGQGPGSATDSCECECVFYEYNYCCNSIGLCCAISSRLSVLTLKSAFKSTSYPVCFFGNQYPEMAVAETLKVTQFLDVFGMIDLFCCESRFVFFCISRSVATRIH